MISPDITISNHRLRWAADGMRFTAPLHYLKREKREEKRRKFYIYPDVTHTHTRQSRGNLERQEEEKSGHTTGRRPKTAKGGRGTDGPPEPTHTAKRTWQKQSTHLNPTTHYGEASRRVIKDQWGLVGEKRNQQKLIGTQVPKQDSVPNYLKVVRYSLSGTVVKSCPSWHKRLSSSIELGAQYVSPHQTTIKRKKPHLESVCLPVIHIMSWMSQAGAAAVKEIVFLVVQSNFTLKERQLAR